MAFLQLERKLCGEKSVHDVHDVHDGVHDRFFTKSLLCCYYYYLF